MDTTKAKLSHNSTKGLVEPPKKQSQAAASSCYLYTLAKQKERKPQNLGPLPCNHHPSFCHRAEDRSMVFNLVF